MHNQHLTVNGACILCFYPSQVNYATNNISVNDEMNPVDNCKSMDVLFRVSPFTNGSMKGQSKMDNYYEEQKEIRQKIYQQMQNIASSKNKEQKESMISEMQLIKNRYQNLERNRMLNIGNYEEISVNIDRNVDQKLIKSAEICVLHGQQNDTMNKSMINYIHFGNPRSDPPHFFILTPDMKWPKEYSVLLWLKWDNKENREYLRTFDSENCSPISVDLGFQLGCETNEEWKFISDFKIKFGEWQFVLVLGGNSCSKYFIGDWSENTEYDVPFVGEVACDISEQITCRIGNQDQGPGMVACILVFDYQLCSQEIKQFYWETKNEVCQQWNHHQIQIIGQLLKKYISVKSIVECIFHFVRFHSY